MILATNVFSEVASVVFLKPGGILIISISESNKNSVTESLILLSESLNKKGSMLFDFKRANLFSEVVDPFTSKPISINFLAKGKPNQPQPRILIFILFFY